MVDTSIISLRHFLRPDGSFAPRSGSALRLAEHFAAIVQELSADLGGGPMLPKVRCRRRPNRKRCPGEIDSILNSVTGEIFWECPVCGDNGFIVDWEGTLWDFSDSSVRH